MDGGLGRRRKFVTPWKKVAQEGTNSSGLASDVAASFPQQPQPQVAEAEASSNSRVQDRLHRLAAMAARAGVASSSKTLSPWVAQGRSNIQGEQRGKKRKSPCVSMPLFRSPMSRMLVSPRIHLPGIRLRTSLVGNRKSPFAQRRLLHIDLNVEVEEENAEGGLDSGIDQVHQENAQNWFDPWFDPIFDSNANDDVSVALEETSLDPGQENVQPQFDPFFDSDGDDVVVPIPQENAHRNIVLDNDKRRAIFDAMLVKARKGYLKGHESKEVSVEFSVPIRTIQRIWKKGKSCLDQGIPVDVASGRSRCGRKKMVVDVSKLEDMSVLSRTTVRDVATQLGVSKSKVQRMRKEGAIKRVSSSLDPHLTDQNKIARLKWCLEMLDPRSVPHNPVFKPLFDHIFIDKKWFYITRKTMQYYAAPTAACRVRTIQNKNFIPKIMILTALARPRFDSNGNCTFDGKIGCFPFVTHTAAKRSSVNRPAGTIEMKPIESITKEVIQNFMIEKVLPAVRAKWPREDVGRPIYIQQDNARPHISPDDRSFCEAARQDGFDIKLVCQPANSPDLNVLDLGFFNSIQSIQHKSASTTVEELVAAVDQAYQDYPVRRSNKIFLSLHACMREIIKEHGGNSFDLPHIKKGVLERQGRLPLQLRCDAKLVDDARLSLRTMADT